MKLEMLEMYLIALDRCSYVILSLSFLAPHSFATSCDLSNLNTPCFLSIHLILLACRGLLSVSRRKRYNGLALFLRTPEIMETCTLRGHPGVQKHCRATWTILIIQMCYVGNRKRLIYGPTGPLKGQICIEPNFSLHTKNWAVLKRSGVNRKTAPFVK